VIPNRMIEPYFLRFRMHPADPTWQIYLIMSGSWHGADPGGHWDCICREILPRSSDDMWDLGSTRIIACPTACPLIITDTPPVAGIIDAGRAMVGRLPWRPRPRATRRAEVWGWPG
jgi:hypothetical protein